MSPPPTTRHSTSANPSSSANSSSMTLTSSSTTTTQTTTTSQRPTSASTTTVTTHTHTHAVMASSNSTIPTNASLFAQLQGGSISLSDRDRFNNLLPESHRAVMHAKVPVRDSSRPGSSRHSSTAMPTNLSSTQDPNSTPSSSPSNNGTGRPNTGTGASNTPTPGMDSGGKFGGGGNGSMSRNGSGSAAGNSSAKNGNGTMSASERRRDIVIHVFDENRNAKKDFFCKQHVLLREMKYFSEYLTDKTTRGHVDIDVHCDIEVFEWLMAYITRQRPALEPRTAISILISSNFLQMQGLEDVCLEYVHDHINEIVKVPIDMSCVNKSLLQRLVKLFYMNEFDGIVDPKDKVLSKLYMHKIGDLLSNPIPSANAPPDRTPTSQIYFIAPATSSLSTSQKNQQSSSTSTSTSTSAVSPQQQPIILRRCLKCFKIYSKKEEVSLVCDEGIPSMDFHGELLLMHERDPEFDVNEWAASLVLGNTNSSNPASSSSTTSNNPSGGITWQNLLWKIWGIIHHFDCIECKRRFSLADFDDGCFRHLEPLTFSQGGHSGVGHSHNHGNLSNQGEAQKGRYPCCNEGEYRFHPFGAAKGCHKFPHVISDTDKASYLYKLFEAHREQVVRSSFSVSGSVDASKERLKRPQSASAPNGLRRLSRKPEEFENGVRSMRIYGKWNENIYERCDPTSQSAPLLSKPVGSFGPPIPPTVVPSNDSKTPHKKLPQYLQREEDNDRMTLLLKQLSKLGNAGNGERKSFPDIPAVSVA
ncbi:hypothetical protein HDU76_013411 [Blyttiomyces sp. JEL0837]|nr:hypothetical protein HDU76_013411 [Blyttiomyces sp. JEL0837]